MENEAMRAVADVIEARIKGSIPSSLEDSAGLSRQ